RDSLCYFDCQFQCRGRLRTRNTRLAPRAGTFNERSELKLQRFLTFNLDPVARDASPNPSVDFAALILVVEREICVLLKDANLTEPLGTDTARCNIGYATVFKMQPRIGNVFAPAKNGHTDCVDAPKRRAHKVQNNFQIMDHQIEDDTDIGAALGVRRKPMRFNEPGMGQMRFECPQNRIEPFHVADLQNEAATRG